MTNCDLSAETHAAVKGVCRLFEDRVRECVTQRSLAPFAFPALFPCNMLVVVDARLVHVVFTNTNAGGLPNQHWKAWKEGETVEPEQVLSAAVQQFGFENAQAFHVSIHVLRSPEELRIHLLGKLATQYVDRVVKELTKPKAIESHRYLQPFLDLFSIDYPEWENNVFIAMRFTDSPHFHALFEALTSALARYGLRGLRADMRMYPPDNNLWNNVCVYMMGCKHGICVFEDFDRRDFNPNVSIEYGFMRAAGRQVLLLKEKRLSTLPTDLAGALYREFDMVDAARTIEDQIGSWAANELGRTRLQ